MSEEEFGDRPLDHLRRVMPPWWTGPGLTECGRLANDVQRIVDRSVLKAKFARLGKQRAAMFTCISCMNLYERPSSWERSPLDILHRAIEGARWRVRNRDAGGISTADRMRHELLAISMLVEEHREEYERLVTAIGEAPDLDAARRRARIRAINGGRA